MTETPQTLPHREPLTPLTADRSRFGQLAAQGRSPIRNGAEPRLMPGNLRLAGHTQPGDVDVCEDDN